MYAMIRFWIRRMREFRSNSFRLGDNIYLVDDKKSRVKLRRPTVVGCHIKWSCASTTQMITGYNLY